MVVFQELMLTLKLPKDVVADSRHDAVRNLLTTNTRPLWEDGSVHVPTFPLGPDLATECRQAIAAAKETKVFLRT